MSYSSEVLADNPLFWLRLGESSGTTAVDSSGNGLDGAYVASPTLGAVGLVAGDADTAVTLNGTTQYVSVPNHASFGVDVVTFELLISGTASSGVLISHAGAANPDKGCQLQLSSGAVQFVVFETGGTGHSATSAKLVNDGNRHHVAGMFDGNVISVLVDGALSGSTAYSQSPLPHSSQPVLVGARPNGPTSFLAATVDEAAIYGAALSAARVSAHAVAAGFGYRRPPGRYATRSAVIRASVI